MAAQTQQDKIDKRWSLLDARQKRQAALQSLAEKRRLSENKIASSQPLKQATERPQGQLKNMFPLEFDHIDQVGHPMENEGIELDADILDGEQDVEDVDEVDAEQDDELIDHDVYDPLREFDGSPSEFADTTTSDGGMVGILESKALSELGLEADDQVGNHRENMEKAREEKKAYDEQLFNEGEEMMKRLSQRWDARVGERVHPGENKLKREEKGGGVSCFGRSISPKYEPVTFLVKTHSYRSLQALVYPADGFFTHSNSAGIQPAQRRYSVRIHFDPFHRCRSPTSGE